MKHSWFTFLLLERDFCEKHVIGYDYRTIVRRGEEGLCEGVPCPPEATCVGVHCINCIYKTMNTVDEWKEKVLRGEELWKLPL